MQYIIQNSRTKYLEKKLLLTTEHYYKVKKKKIIFSSFSYTAYFHLLTYHTA